MGNYEYKTVKIKLKGSGFFGSREAPALEDTLNREGENGWRLCSQIQPSGGFGEATSLILIFERER